MAISIDYSDTSPEYIINIPRADMLDVTGGSPTEIRQLNVNAFRLNLDDLNDDMIGINFPDTHSHTPPLTVAGVTLARVVEILDPYVIQFEDGAYNVNIVGGNSNISDVTIKNQVGVNTANSAGLQDPFSLQAAAFGGEIAVDITSPTTGTTFPFGTRSFPVSNLADALLIAQERGIRRLRILSAMTISGGSDFSDGYQFVGDNPTILVTVASSPDVSGCEFRNLSITGTLDGGNTLRTCSIFDIAFFNGFMFQCGVIGDITLGGTEAAFILQCYSLVAGGGSGQIPYIDLGGTQLGGLVVRDWQGGLGLKNCTDQQADCSIDMSSGRIVADATITDGVFVVRGIGDPEDSSGPGATVDTSKLINNASITAAVNAAAKLDDLHAFQVRNMTEDVTGGVRTYDTDGGRQMVIDDDAGTRVTTGAEPA